MTLCSEKTNFNEYVWQDKAIRAAAGDCTADEFRNILEQMYENEPEMIDTLQKDVSCCEFMVELILSVQRKTDKLKVFYEVKRSAWLDMVYNESGIFSLLISCLKNDDEAAEYIIKNAMCRSDLEHEYYFVHPLYFLMITEKYHLVPAVLKKSVQLYSQKFELYEDKIEKDIDMKFFGCNGEFIAVSAAYFEDKQFLTALFDSGLSINDYMAIQLILEPCAFEFIANNFFDKLGLDKPVSIYEFIKERFSTEKILSLAMRLPDDAFDSFTEELIPLKKTDKLCDFIVAQYYRVSLDSKTNNELDFIRGSVDKKLTIVVRGEGQVIYTWAESIFADSSITYDLTSLNRDVYFSQFSNRELNDILKRNVIFASAYVIFFVKLCLGRNQKKLTRLLIKKGLINKDNYEEALEFVIAKRCLNSLAVLSTVKGFGNSDQ